MKYLILTTLILISFTSCGKPPQYHDAEFASYISNFETTYNQDTSSVVVEFTDTELSDSTEIDANCYRTADKIAGIKYRNSNVILVSRSHWKAASELRKQIIINHEFGHCIFNRSHKSDTLSDGCPASQMFPYTNIVENCMPAHKDDYVAELPNN